MPIIIRFVFRIFEFGLEAVQFRVPSDGASTATLLIAQDSWAITRAWDSAHLF